MTRMEAEVFILAVSGFDMDMTDVLKRYRHVPLQTALEENLGEIAQYIDLKPIEAEVMEFPWNR